jgi:23S rRNA (uracil1939-C5)-methyltransferase
MIKKVQVKIDSMAFKGYGVARTNGKVVFTPYSVTGDEAWVEIIEEKKNYSMGRLLEIVRPSPWRVEPPCPYFGGCGGCQWQHIDYSKHGELKKEILTEILKRLGGLKEIPSIAVAPSPQPYDYRIRVQLKVKEKAIGYYEERSHHIVDIDHCPISHPLINQIIRSLREELSSFSRMEEIEINVSPEEGKGILVLHPLPSHKGMKELLKEFLDTHSILKGIAIRRKERSSLFGNSRLDFTVSLNRYVENRLLMLRVSPESFFQVNLKQNETLIQRVLEFADVKGNGMTLDLYAGIGNITLPLAIISKEIWGIEENLVAVKDARFNAERNGIENCSFIHGKVEDVLNRWKKERPDLIVLDPPRTGCKTTLDQVVSLKPKKIVYISCEPTTLSRDLHLFSNRGYALHGLALIDMFPQTYHMEVIGLLTQP